jgi:hypothetical protein
MEKGGSGRPAGHAADGGRWQSALCGSAGAGVKGGSNRGGRMWAARERVGRLGEGRSWAGAERTVPILI